MKFDRGLGVCKQRLNLKYGHEHEPTPRYLVFKRNDEMRHIFLLVVRRYYLLDRLCVRVLCMCYLVGGEACLGALSMCGRHCSERGFTVCTRAERGRGRIDKSINVMVPPLRQQSNNLMHCRQTDRQTLAAARRAKLSIRAEGGIGGGRRRIEQ